MAVATTRRVRADRAVKDRILQKLGHGPVGALRNMSFKLPPQPGNAGEQQLMSSPNPADGYQIPAARYSALKKRKAAKVKGPTGLRCASSTPHLHGPSSGDSGPLSPNSDKRRNKLGYHRTSVACGSIAEMPGLTQSPQPESEIGPGSELPGYGGSSENGVNYAAVPVIFSTPGPAWGAPMHQPHSQPRQVQDDPQSPYWSTPVTSTYPSEPVFGQIDAAAENFVSDYSYHQPQTWAPPSRSLSYSEMHGQGHQYPYNEAYPQYSQHPVAPGYHFSPPHQLNHATFSSPDPSRAMMAPNAAWNHPAPTQPGYGPSEQQVPVQSILRSTWYPPAPSYPGVDEKSQPSPHPPSHYYTNVSNPG
ncbi:gb [Venturia nashicola]|nr:gb [Venturia nashicola]